MYFKHDGIHLSFNKKQQMHTTFKHLNNLRSSIFCQNECVFTTQNLCDSTLCLILYILLHTIAEITSVLLWSVFVFLFMFRKTLSMLWSWNINILFHYIGLMSQQHIRNYYFFFSFFLKKIFIQLYRSFNWRWIKFIETMSFNWW